MRIRQGDNAPPFRPMQHYRERNFDVKGEEDTVTVGYVGQPPNWNPPFATSIAIKYQTPTYSRKFERFWWDDNRAFDWLPYNESYRRQWHPCQHYMRWMNDSVRDENPKSVPWNVMSLTAIGGYASNRPGAHRLLTVDHPVFRSQFGTYGSHVSDMPSMTVEYPDKSFIDPPVALNTFCSAALGAMLPDIKANLSLVNSIIELKDFASLGRTLAGIKRWTIGLPSLVKNLATTQLLEPRKYALKSTYRKIRGSFTAAGDLTLREMFRAPADAYLQAEFNILPLLSDIKGIYDALSTLERRLKDLYQRQGRLQRKHYDKWYLPYSLAAATKEKTYTLDLNQFAGTVSPSGYTGSYRAYGSPIRATREVTVFPSVFHAEIEYRYYFTQFQNEHARILSLLDMMGVNLNPAIIWNAIPWSFVVDWVLGVSHWLSDRKTLNMEPGISIERFLWSNKNTRRTRLFIENVSAPTWSSKMLRTYMPDLNETSYRRDIKLPSFTDPLFAGSLNSRELSLGVALAITRRRHSNLRLRG